MSRASTITRQEIEAAMDRFHALSDDAFWEAITHALGLKRGQIFSLIGPGDRCDMTSPTAGDAGKET